MAAPHMDPLGGGHLTPPLSLAALYTAGPATGPIINLDATHGPALIRDSSGGLGTTLFGVQNAGGTTKYFDVLATGISTDSAGATAIRIYSGGTQRVVEGVGLFDSNGDGVLIASPGNQRFDFLNGCAAAAAIDRFRLHAYTGTATTGGNLLAVGDGGTFASKFSVQWDGKVFVTSDVDRLAAGTLTIGGATATAVQVGRTGQSVGFYGTAPVAKATVSGAKGSNAALGSLMTALAALGLVTDSTSA